MRSKYRDLVRVVTRLIKALDYIGFVSPLADDWRVFGTEVLGMQLADDGPGGEVRLRLDSLPARICITPGVANELGYLGWSVESSDALIDTIDAVRAVGIAVHQGDATLATLRCAVEVAWFVDPVGFRHELALGLQQDTTAFVPGRPISGFLTGEGGLGHVVLFVPDMVAAEAFFTNVLGFKFSDDISMGPLYLRFFHCNPRHHTIALAEIPGMRGVHHIMVEVSSLDDVGRALDICTARELPLAMAFGKHTNDLMTSFYVRTPSGFEVEYGYGGLLIDEATWEPAHFDAVSIWGHRPPAAPLFPGVISAALSPPSPQPQTPPQQRTTGAPQ
jgi:extradiol dioxygenase